MALDFNLEKFLEMIKMSKIVYFLAASYGSGFLKLLFERLQFLTYWTLSPLSDVRYELLGYCAQSVIKGTWTSCLRCSTESAARMSTLHSAPCRILTLTLIPARSGILTKYLFHFFEINSFEVSWLDILVFSYAEWLWRVWSHLFCLL